MKKLIGRISAARLCLPLFLAVIITLALTGRTSAADSAQVVSKLQKKYESITSLSATFRQETASKSLGQPHISEGVVYFKKPGKMRWIYQTPSKDELISNGRMIWVYQPDLNQVMERSTEGAPSSIATDFLSGIGNLARDFSITIEDSSAGVYLLNLAPKVEEPNVKDIRLEVDRKSFLVLKTFIEDYFGNVTTVSFTDIKLNAPQKDSFFDFTPPKDAAVIKP